MNTTIQTTVIERELRPDNTLFLYLEKPPEFEYRAGQFVELRLDEQGEWYPFTLSSAPHEERLLIVTRIRESAFKQQLKGLGRGDAIELTGPWGNFVLPDDLPKHIVFLAGGLGANVFRSMLVQGGFKNSVVWLFVSVRQGESLVFHDELQKFSQLVYVPTVTGEVSNGWRGERGRISSDLLLRYGVPQDALVYIAGSTGFVHSMIGEVTSADIPLDQLRIEHFTGY